MVGESDKGTKIRGWCAQVCEKWKEMKRKKKTLKTKLTNKQGKKKTFSLSLGLPALNRG